MLYYCKYGYIFCDYDDHFPMGVAGDFPAIWSSAGYSALRMLLALRCRSAGPSSSGRLHIDSMEADAVHAVVACNVLQVAGDWHS